MRKHINTKALNPNTTYCAEVIYPENRIVVAYDTPQLCLLSAYEADGRELTPEESTKVAEEAKFTRPTLFSFDTIDAMLAKAKVLDGGHEGFVVRLHTGDRLKIKGDEYIRLHRVRGKVTPLGLWEMMLAGDDLEKVRFELEEEVRKDFDTIRRLIEGQLVPLVDELKEAYELTKSMSDRDLGIQMKTGKWKDGKSINELVRTSLFVVRSQGGLATMPARGSPLRMRLLGRVRPTGDVLAGYTPSSVMTRFEDDG
jgi:RNA ligase